MRRPGWDDIYMRFASVLSERSTCDRLKVGCVIVSEDNNKVLSLGYNGGPAKVSNGCLSSEPGKCGHLHAEINALIKLDYNDPCRKKAYVTTQPCYMCAVALVNAKVSEVIYQEAYRLTDGLKLLTDAGIAVRQYTPSSTYGDDEPDFSKTKEEETR